MLISFHFYYYIKISIASCVAIWYETKIVLRLKVSLATKTYGCSNGCIKLFVCYQIKLIEYKLERRWRRYTDAVARIKVCAALRNKMRLKMVNPHFKALELNKL